MAETITKLSVAVKVKQLGYLVESNGFDKPKCVSYRLYRSVYIPVSRVTTDSLWWFFGKDTTRRIYRWCKYTVRH